MKPVGKVVLAGLLISLLLGGVVSFWASAHPDGLERVAEDTGFLERTEENEAQKSLAPAPDYEAPGLDGDFSKVSAAGLVGAALAFAGAFGLFWLLRRRRTAGA